MHNKRKLTTKNVTKKHVLSEKKLDIFPKTVLAQNSKDEFIKSVLKDALFVPDNSKNLIAVSKLREAGSDVFFCEKLKPVFNKSVFLLKLKMDFLCEKFFLYSNEI